MHEWRTFFGVLFCNGAVFGAAMYVALRMFRKLRAELEANSAVITKQPSQHQPQQQQQQQQVQQQQQQQQQKKPSIVKMKRKRSRVDKGKKRISTIGEMLSFPKMRRKKNEVTKDIINHLKIGGPKTSKSDLEADNSNFGLKIIYNRRNDTNTPAFSVMEGPGTNASATEHTLAAMRASLSNKLEIESIMELALEDEQQLVNDQEAKRSSYESLPVASIEAQASEVVNSAEKTEDKPTVPSAVETDYYE